MGIAVDKLLGSYSIGSGPLLKESAMIPKYDDMKRFLDHVSLVNSEHSATLLPFQISEQLVHLLRNSCAYYSSSFFQ